MALQLTRNSIICRITRQFYCNCNNKTKCMSTNIPKVEKKGDDIHSIGAHMHKVSNFDKAVLVWVKRYPSIAEVPKQVTADCMLQARSRARVRVCNIMIVFTLVSFLLAIFSGKKDAAEGKSLYSMRQEWYEGLKKEHEAELAALAEKADKK